MKWKAVLGVVLAVLSLLALYLWESKYEDQVMLTPVLVAAKDIEEGKAISLADLKIIRITPESKLDKALTREQAEFINGKIAICNIAQNQQLCPDYFVGRDELRPKGLFNFVIPDSWIYSESILIGERSHVDLFAMPDRTYLGSYMIDKDYDSALEIMAVLSDYYRIYDAVIAAGNRLLITEAGASESMFGGIIDE